MKVVDELLLMEFRAAGRCDWCREWFPVLEPHHLWARGMGGAFRIDTRYNLAALCLGCHRAHHDGNEPTKLDLLAVVAARESVTQDEIERVVLAIRRAPKGSDLAEVLRAG